MPCTFDNIAVWVHNNRYIAVKRLSRAKRTLFASVPCLVRAKWSGLGTGENLTPIRNTRNVSSYGRTAAS